MRTVPHGEGVLLFPFGTLIALIAVIALSLRCKIRWFAALCAAALALAASLPFWFIPGNYFPAVMHHADWGYFVTGFVPSIAAGGVAVWLFRRARRSAH